MSQKNFSLALLLLFALSACGELPTKLFSKPRSDDVSKMLDVDIVHSDLVISTLNDQEILRKGESIDLLLSNETRDKISFEPGYGSQLFIFDKENQEWIEVSNRVTYIGEGDILSPKEGNTKNWLAYLSVSPEVPGDFNADVLRVGVAGRLVEDGTITNHKVGAYIDIILK